MLQPDNAEQHADHNDAFVAPRAEGKLRHQCPHALPHAELEEAPKDGAYVGFVRIADLDELVGRGVVEFDELMGAFVI